MNKIKTVFAVFLCVLIFSVQVSAADYWDYYYSSLFLDSDEFDSFQAGMDLADFIDMFMENYVGKDLTVEELYDAALKGMSELMDDYSEYYTEDEYYSYIGSVDGDYSSFGIYYEITDEGFLLITDTVVDSSAREQGVMAGDMVMYANGILLSGLDRSEKSQLFSDLDEVVLTILRNGAEIKITLVKTILQVETVFVARLEEMMDIPEDVDTSHIRYIYISSINETASGHFTQAMAELKAEGVTHMILDLRGNLGGYMDAAVDICSELVPKGPICYVVSKSGQRRVEMSYLPKSPMQSIIVLTDGDTASAAEVIASALQDSQAGVLVGETTFGKGIVQGVMPSATNGSFKFTYAEYLRRNGGKVNGLGVVPDVLVDLPQYIQSFVEFNSLNQSEQMPNIKELLQFIGYETGPVDMEYDEVTRSSIRKLQADNGIPESGELNLDTLLALNQKLYEARYENDLVLDQAVNMLTAGIE